MPILHHLLILITEAKASGNHPERLLRMHVSDLNQTMVQLVPWQI
jgi:hypothetical protein